MKKGVFLILIALVLFCLTNLVLAIDINSCRNIDSSEIYTLTQNVSSSGTCFNITAADVILDCNGYTINYSSSSQGDGIYTNSNNTLIKNCIIRQGSNLDGCYGIELDRVSNGLINNTSSRTECHGDMEDTSEPIYLYNSHYNAIANTNTTSSGGFENQCPDYSFGLFLEDSNYNNITNFRQSGGYNGPELKGANYNNFVNVTSIVIMDNLNTESGSSHANYNTFTNCYFRAIWSSAILAFTSEQNSFFNSVLISDKSAGESIALKGGNNGEYNLTNCTINDTSTMTFISGAINVFWYTEVYVNDSNGNPVNGVNVSTYDVHNNLKNTQLTNSSGYIQRIALREFVYNSSLIKYYDTNYTFNVSKPGYSYDASSGPLNLTTNHIGSNKVWITLTDDNALTALFGTNPIDNYKSNSSSMTFDFKCSYNSSVSTIQLWTNATGEWKADYSNSSYLVNTWLNITVPGIPNNQNYKWAIYCNTSDSSDWTGNRTFNVDATAPVAEQGTNPIDNYNNSGGLITFDLKCSDNVGVQNIQLWTNTTGTWQPSYSNLSYENDTWLNITLMGIHDGNYRWAVYCNDASGSGNWTGNRAFNVTAGSQISGCTNITLSGNYILNQSIISNTTCINILADDVTLDCNGYNISFSNSVAGAGVYSNSNNTTVKNCVIEGATKSDSYGIKFSGTNNGLIDNNSITASGSFSYGIFLNNADNNSIINTNTTSWGFYSCGILFDGADHNNVANYMESGGFWGINLGMDAFTSDYNNFVNVSLITGGESIQISSASNYNTFTNGYFESTDSTVLYAGHSNENSFFNSVLTGAGSIYLGEWGVGEYNFTNCTINSSISVLGESSLNVFWLADVYVNDSNGAALSRANVTAKNVNNVLKDWDLTNSSGYTKRFTLRGYMRNVTGTYYDTKYNFSASKNGYSSNSEQVNLTSNAIDGNLGKVVLTLSATSAPNISMIDDQTIYLPDAVTLAALVTSDSDFTVEWSKISGHGSATFSNQDKTITDVSFSVPGDYVVRITASDGTYSRYEEATITVLPEPLNIKVKKSGTGDGIVSSSGTEINCGSDCSKTLEDETLVTLTATPASGSIFIGWVGAGCLGNESDTCTVNVNGTKEVTAFFDTNTTGIRTFYVATNGSDSNNGSIDFPWLTIQHAANTVVAGDKVIIEAGIYNEFLEFPNSGNSTHPIVFEGERGENGEWLTIIDPSSEESSGWIPASEIGSGVWKKDVGFNATELTINNKKVARIFSMGDISEHFPYIYRNVNWTTGADILSVPADALIDLVTSDASTSKLRFWDGLEASWGYSGNTAYLRLRNGTNPNGMNIHVTNSVTPSLSWADPAFFISGKSYLDFRNFNARNLGVGFWIQDDTHHITIESNSLSGGSLRVFITPVSHQNLIRNNEMTSNFYGYSDIGAYWNDMADYRWTVRSYPYLFGKYIMTSNYGSDDEAIYIGGGNENIISGNHIFRIYGQGISIRGPYLEDPMVGTEIYDNIIEHQASNNLLIITGNTNTKIHDNVLSDARFNVRFHHTDEYGETNRTVYLYKNKFWLPEGIGEHIRVHFYDEEPDEYHPTFWVYHNSFTGGFAGFSNGGSSENSSMQNMSLINNIFSGPDFVFYAGMTYQYNDSVMGEYDYNFGTNTFCYWGYPIWYGPHNLNQSSPIWDLSTIPDYSLEPDSEAIDAGIDLSHNFTINGTNYTALPGMEPGYFLGSAPDMGAVEYDNSTMIISRGSPLNNFNSNSHDITFEFKCLYNYGVDSIELWTNVTGVWERDYSDSDYESNSWLNITLEDIPDNQNYKWGVYCYGEDGNSSYKGNRTFNVDTINPIAEQGTNPAEGYKDSVGSVTFDLKCSDNLGVSSIQLQTDISGSLQTEYSNSSYQNDTWLNITIDGITSGDYIWKVYCEDIAGNSYTTSSRAFSSTYAEEEEQEEQKKGGGGGGGDKEENPTNATNVNNVSNSASNLVDNNNNDKSSNANQTNQKVKNKLQKYWWLIVVTVVVIAGLIVLGSIKKKDSVENL